MSEDDGLKAMGQSSRLMKPGSGIISARWFVGRLRRPSTRYWMRKRIGFAVQDVTNALKAGRIPGPAATNARCTQ
jgi:hypothetical protein